MEVLGKRGHHLRTVIPFIWNKGGRLAAFFALALLLHSSPARGQALENSTPWLLAPHEHALAQHPQWAALLHHDGRRPNISDPLFLLSGEAFSLEAELKETLKLLYQGPPDAVCRFPARYLWIQRKTGRPSLPIEQCAELAEFSSRAPMDEVSLVFASEVLSMPSSMMGHLFLKVRGQHTDGAMREHAVSFFTEPVTWNLPKLFYDSLIAGMKGYFSLTPFQQEVELYIGKEGRNLWIYPLQIDGDGLRLLQAHIIELKNIELTYFFQRYNCATLVKHLLAIENPKILEHGESWTTPKDVVRAAAQHGLTSEPTTLTASRWTLRILQTDLNAQDIEQVTRDVMANHVPTTGTDERSFLKLKAAQALNLYLYEKDQRDRSTWLRYAQQLSAQETSRFPGWSMESRQRQRDPAYSPPDMQWEAGITKTREEARVRLEVLPASHKLEDDNRGYFAESALTLFNVAVSTPTNKQRLRLDRAIVYGTESLLPRDTWTGGWSGRFRLGWDQLRTPDLRSRGTWLVEGGLGMTWRPQKDIDVFALMAAGASMAQRGHLYAAPEVGLIIREIWDMKSILRLAWTHNERASGRTIRTTEFVQVKRLGKNISIAGHHRDTEAPRARVKEIGLRLKYLF